MTQSEAAFILSAKALFERNRKVYFWTLTFPKVYAVWCVPSAWNHLSKLLCKWYGKIEGLRVMEYHEQHGCHFHILINKRLPVDVLRRVAKSYGFGRVHVCRCDYGAAEYMAKYLSKDDRPMHARHKWAAIGRGWSVKKKDIYCQSSVASAMRRAYAATQGAPRAIRFGEMMLARNKAILDVL